ncbi:MAG TPA: HAMP domain-containing protein [Polyangiaceae bacterium]|jgi:nitrogen fixation/metabolism regulation signal transduction histidine kinase|nr:HAMP domain-containing protein [Polyangiaceae bacterium]
MGDNAEAARPKYKRSAKNYLLDPHFQLKYTAFLVAIALVLSAVLGTLLWTASQEIVGQTQRTLDQSAETVKRGQETVERGKLVIDQSNKVNQVVTTTIESCYADNPALLDSFRSEAAKDGEKLKDEQKKLEADAALLSSRTEEFKKNGEEVAARQAKLKLLLVVALLALVFGIGVAGIVFTHKIAGPIFKMKRLLRQIGEGKLVLKEKLRKGDELQHFFETFEQVVDQLRAKQMQEIEKLDAIIERIGAAESNSDALSDLKKLRAEMQDELEG